MFWFCFFFPFQPSTIWHKNSQHSMGLDATCSDTVLPVGWLMWILKTILTRVFLRPMSVSPFLSSMSELRSFKIPAQSILSGEGESRGEWAAEPNQRLSARQITISFYDTSTVCTIYMLIYGELPPKKNGILGFFFFLLWNPSMSSGKLKKKKSLTPLPTMQL